MHTRTHSDAIEEGQGRRGAQDEASQARDRKFATCIDLVSLKGGDGTSDTKPKYMAATVAVKEAITPSNALQASLKTQAAAAAETNFDKLLCLHPSSVETRQEKG